MRQAPADGGLADSLGLLEAWVEAQRAYLDIPGISMAVVHGKDVIWSKGFGLANREAKLAAAPDTLYSICSISKLFTSLGVLQLRDEGKLALDAADRDLSALVRRPAAVRRQPTRHAARDPHAFVRIAARVGAALLDRPRLRLPDARRDDRRSPQPADALSGGHLLPVLEPRH